MSTPIHIENAEGKLVGTFEDHSEGRASAAAVKVADTLLALKGIESALEAVRDGMKDLPYENFRSMLEEKGALIVKLDRALFEYASQRI